MLIRRTVHERKLIDTKSRIVANVLRIKRATRSAPGRGGYIVNGAGAKARSVSRDRDKNPTENYIFLVSILATPRASVTNLTDELHEIITRQRVSSARPSLAFAISPDTYARAPIEAYLAAASAELYHPLTEREREREREREGENSAHGRRVYFPLLLFPFSLHVIFFYSPNLLFAVLISAAAAARAEGPGNIHFCGARLKGEGGSAGICVSLSGHDINLSRGILFAYPPAR